MNIPDNEMLALFDWSTVELERIDREYPDIPGALDGPSCQAQKLHFKEYNKRLAILKEQYTTEATVQSKTFNQLLQTGTH